MPNAYALSLNSGFWPVITRLGEAQLMLPSGLALVAWLAWSGERRSAALWLGLLSLAIGVTTASKIAFVGWGIGNAPLNFTGVSGHAMFATAVFPLLLRCLTASSGRAIQHVAVVLGFAVGAVVAVSRVAVGAHSVSESIAGFLLGGGASALSLALGTVPHQHLPRWLVGGLIAAQLLNPAAAPTLPTHDMVTRLGLWVSGHDKPYRRTDMLREYRERQKARAVVGITGPLSLSMSMSPAVVASAAPHPPTHYNASAVVFFTSSITA